MLFTSDRLAVRSHELPYAEPSQSIRVLEGQRLVLDGKTGPIVPKLVSTNSLVEYTSWIGLPDEEAPPLAELEKYWPLPRPCANPDARLADLDDAELTLLDRAAWHYVFGDSRRVESYRRLIETVSAPFCAAIYATGNVEIMAGAEMIVEGIPAILLFDNVRIHSTGRLVTYTPCNARFGNLEKDAAITGHFN